MAKMLYDERTQKVWEKARKCNRKCRQEDCHPNNHRLCSICYEPIFYGSHESNLEQQSSRYSWNIDHITPISKGGSGDIHNLQAVHVSCNKNKGSN